LLKRLQYYADFTNYHRPATATETLPLFLKKLTKKNQTQEQLIEAEKAVQRTTSVSRRWGAIRFCRDR
jgi:hypothetical protein